MRLGRRRPGPWRAATVLAAVLASVAALTAPAAGTTDGQGASRAPGRPSAPTGLRTNSLPAPADVDAAGPVEFGWQSALRRQGAYKIEVTRAGADRPVWATGKVESAQSSAVRYAGPALRTGERYEWRVQVWDEDRRPSGWSGPASFGTGPGADWGGSAPVWPRPPAGEKWTDYRVDVTITVTRTALGVRFRSPDARNGYMWQFRAAGAANPNTLVPHIQTNGRFSAGDPVPLGAELRPGTEHRVGIEAVGSTLTTTLDGRVVDRRTDTAHAEGVIGFRNGGSESGVVDDVRVTDLTGSGDGAELYRNDFDDPAAGFPCGIVADGALSLGTGVDCLNANLANDWALFRDDFSLAPGKKVAWATVFATGSAFSSAKQYVYKMYLDGEFVGLGPTSPTGDEVRYDGFDLTDRLRERGPHTLSAIAYATEDRRFQAHVIVRYTDGTTQTLGTGADWQARTGNDIWTSTDSIGTNYWYAPQEDVSMAAFPDGFDKPGFTGPGWAAPEVKEPFGKLAPTPFAKVEEQTHAPAEIVDLGGGDYFVDFGRTWMGGVRLTLDGRQGQQVRLRFGEELEAPYTARYRMRTGNTYEDVLTLRDGRQTAGTWGMRVFRYLNIVDSPVPITKENLGALAMVYPFDRDAAELTSSDPGLVKVWQFTKDTIETANQNFFTDSWTRERTNYEADAYIQLLANLHLTEDPTLSQYSMDYFEENRTWPTEWPMYVISAVYDTWQRTGSTAQIERAYDTLKPKLLDEDYDPATGTIVQRDAIVDWPDSQRDGYRFTDQNTVLNALAYSNYRQMETIARELGHAQDAADFRAKARTIRDALNTRFYDAEQGAYDDGLDKDGVPTGHRAVHASVFPAAFGVPADAGRRGAVADYIASRGMACSVYCSGFLLEALYDADHGQDALDLLTSTGTNGWLHMLDIGAGATGEAWDPGQKPNMTWSHPWATAPAYVIPRDMYGIEPTSPGYATFRVRPQTGDQRFGSVTLPTVKGTIGVSFHRSGGRQDLGVRVPGNTTGTVGVLAPEGHGGAVVFVDGRPVRGDRDGDRITVRVGAGCHVLSTSWTASVGGDERLTGICRKGD